MVLVQQDEVAERKQVLVVEDEAAVRTELCELLEDEGYDVIGASNGEQALAALNAGAHPAVVVLDLMMPVMNGYEFLEKLRERGDKVEVVLATAADTDSDSDDVLLNLPRVRKPFCVEPLLTLLHDRLLVGS